MKTITANYSINSIEELITAAGFVENDQIITGKQLKEASAQCIKLKNELNLCHQFFDEIGVPKSNTGLNGVKQRLESLSALLKNR